MFENKKLLSGYQDYLDWQNGHKEERIFQKGRYDQAEIDILSYEPDQKRFSTLGPRAGIAQSNLLWEDALRVIPAGSQTLSKAPMSFVDGVSPKYLQRGKGSHVWDVDGNEYIDYVLGCFPITLGYTFPEVDEAIRAQLSDGITFSMMHPLEVEVSNRLVEMIPGAEMVRFAKNGSDVTSMAIRLARHITDRQRVACVGYHGFQDWYIATTDRSYGIPGCVKELTSTFKYNDIESLEKLFSQYHGEFACVIMEPSLFELPKNSFLQQVKDLVHENGALLIFDEMLSGFRYSLGGAQELFGITPDLATFGKGVANGMPIGVLVGLEEHMSHFEKVFFSSTYGGEALTLAAARATLDFYKENDVIDVLWRNGKVLFDSIHKLIAEKRLEEFISIIGIPVRFQLIFKDLDHKPNYLLNAFFQQEMTKSGVICYANPGVSYSHSVEEQLYTAWCFGRMAEIMKKAILNQNIQGQIEGNPSRPVFKALRASRQTAN